MNRVAAFFSWFKLFWTQKKKAKKREPYSLFEEGEYYDRNQTAREEWARFWRSAFARNQYEARRK